VYDLQAVTFGELSSHPLLAGHDAKIQLNRHPIRLHPQLLDQLAESERTFDGAIFPIDDDFHPCRSSQGKGGSRKSGKRSALGGRSPARIGLKRFI
jgi:hypothetical protein